jgi:hypothetical protein
MLMATAVCGQANVLFVGNSYIYTNNLPQMTADVASSAGYRMTWESNAPGGCTFMQHCTNQSMTMIRNGGWGFASTDTADATLIESCALAYWAAMTTKRDPSRKAVVW